MKKILIIIILVFNVSLSYADDSEIYKELINVANSIMDKRPATVSLLNKIALELGADRHKAYFKVEGIPNMHVINNTDGFSFTFGYYLILGIQKMLHIQDIIQ